MHNTLEKKIEKSLKIAVVHYADIDTIRRGTCAHDFVYDFHLQYTTDKRDDGDGVMSQTKKYIRKPCIFAPQTHVVATRLKCR